MVELVWGLDEEGDISRKKARAEKGRAGEQRSCRQTEAEQAVMAAALNKSTINAQR